MDSSLAELAQATHAVDLMKICQLVPTIVVLYDHLITIDQDVNLVWAKPWTTAKVLYLWNRHFGSLFLLTEALIIYVQPISDQFCHNWFIIQCWSAAVIIWSMQGIMLFRTFAMYNQNRLVMALLLCCFTLQNLTMALILITSSCKFKAFREPLAGIQFCTPFDVPRFFYIFWLAVVVFDLVHLTFAARVVIKHAKEIRGLEGVPRSPVWETLMKDSMLYFAFSIVTYTASVGAWLTLPIKWLGLPQGFSIACTCVMGIRLTLNLREAYYLPWEEDDEKSVKIVVFPHIHVQSTQIPSPL